MKSPCAGSVADDTRDTKIERPLAVASQEAASVLVGVSVVMHGQALLLFREYPFGSMHITVSSQMVYRLACLSLSWIT